MITGKDWRFCLLSLTNIGFSSVSIYQVGIALFCISNCERFRALFAYLFETFFNLAHYTLGKIIPPR